MKRTFSTELSYVLGLLILALGTAFMERADFGMSMVVAPAYIVHLKLSQSLPFFSFGMAEYCLQLVLILGMCLAFRRVKLGYAFSFVTAVLYGLTLDAMMALVALLPGEGFAVRCVMFAAGMLLCSVGVAFFLHTYIAPEAYELVVKEVAARYPRWSVTRVKTCYDLLSLSAAVILSFCFFGFGHFEGVKLGTLITALVNGWLIGRISHLLEKRFVFKDLLPLRRWME